MFRAHKFLFDGVGLSDDIFQQIEQLDFNNADIAEVKNTVNALVKVNWSNIILSQPKEQQCCAKFQQLLSTALEK